MDFGVEMNEIGLVERVRNILWSCLMNGIDEYIIGSQIVQPDTSCTILDI